MVLVCNDAGAADRLLAGLQYGMPAVSLVRLARMHGRHATADSMVKLREDQNYVDALHAMSGIGAKSGDLPLDS
jgi:beta-N-acetylhexosaminidase